MGLEDYTKDIGAERTTEGRESLWARSQIINAARAAGVTPLASVFPMFRMKLDCARLSTMHAQWI